MSSTSELLFDIIFYVHVSCKEGLDNGRNKTRDKKTDKENDYLVAQLK